MFLCALTEDAVTTEVARAFKSQQLKLALRDEPILSEGATVGQELVHPPALGNDLCSLGENL